MDCPDVVPTQEEQDRWDVAPLVKDVPQPIPGELLLKRQSGVGTGRRDALPSISVQREYCSKWSHQRINFQTEWQCECQCLYVTELYRNAADCKSVDLGSTPGVASIQLNQLVKQLN